MRILKVCFWVGVIAHVVGGQFPARTANAAQGAAGSVIYEGLEHTALGAATLTLQSNATELVVDNLGSSGQDGVAITLPAQGRWDGQWQTLDADGSAPKGTYLQGRLLGALADGVVQPLGVLTSTKLGPQQWGWTADFSALGASTYTVSVYDGAKLVSRLTGQDGSHLVASSLPNWDLHVSCCPFVFEITWRNGGGSSGTAFTFAGGTSVHGDRLVLTPENAKDVSALAALELRASGIPQIHFLPAQPAAISLTYGGLEHAALGMATLTLQSNATELVVDNLGSSGQDGVAITLPAQGRWDGQWQTLDADGSAPKGTYLQGRLLGALADGVVQPLGILTSTKLGPQQWGWTADFTALGASTYTVSVYDGAKLVSKLTGQDGGHLVASSLPNWDLHVSCCPFIIEVSWRGGDSSGTAFTFAGGTSVHGDRLVLTPENAKDVSALAALELRASGIPQIHFVPAQAAAISVTYGGLEHTALGAATLTLQSNATELVVDNLGSSGQDGVAITLPAQGRWDGQWQTLDADGSAPKGTYLQGRLLGALADGVVQPLGVLTSTKLGPQQWGWTADFSALGASTYTVSVYDGAKLVSRLTGQYGSNLVASSLPNFDVHIACCPFVFEITWRGGGSSGTAFTFAGGTSVHGDRLVLTPENAKDVSALAALELRASGIPQIHFVAAQPAAISLTYGGLEHAALGMATLTLQSNATELVVDNLGSSGQDGVAITLPAQGRWDGQWQTLDADGSAPKGTYLQGRLLGALADGVVHQLGVLTSTKLGPQQWGWTADFTALGASTYTVSVYDGAKLVSRLTGQDGSNLLASSLANWDVHIACCPFVFEITWRGGGSSGTAFTFAGGTSVHGDRLVLTPENAKDVSALAALELRGSGIPQIHFVPAQPAAISLTYGGLEHAALGMATLTLQSNATELVVDNLGSSGQDGVAITLPAQGRWDGQWQTLDPDGSAPKGTYLQGRLLGALADGVVQPLGVLTSTKLGPQQWGWTADFTALGASTYTVSVYDGAKLVSRLTGQDGSHLVASSLPNWDLHVSCCPFVFEITWRNGGGSSGTAFTFAGGTSVHGDRLVLTPENAKDVSALAALELRASGIPQIHFLPAQPAAISLTYGGLEHAALGMATLTLQSNATELVVDNLGSSGQDGVAITLPAQGRWDGQWQTLDADGSAPKGTYLQGRLLGALADGVVQPLGILTSTKLGPQQWGWTADFTALGASTYTVSVYDGAKLVSKLTGQDGGHLVASSLPNWDLHVSCCPFIIEVSWRGGDSSGTAFTFAGGTSVHGDRLVLTPENAKDVSALAALELRASGIPQIHFVPAQAAAISVTYGGLEHTALGAATLTLQSNATELVVDNLGSSGQDGVAITLPAQGRWDGQWQTLDADGSAPKGTYLQGRLLGALADGVVQPLGVLTSTKLGPQQWGWTADFSALGASTYTVSVYDGAKLVSRLTGQYGSNLVASSLPNFDVHIACCPFVFEITWRGGGSSGTAFTFAGGTSVHGDRLVLTPENAKDVSALAALELRGSGIPQIHFVPAQPAAISLTYGGLEHAALGMATLTLQSNATELVVDNLGSSGQDGVAITLPAQGRWDGQWQTLDPDGSAPKGTYLQGRLLGALADGVVQPLGVLTSTKLGPQQWGWTADFTALGASTYTVSVYDGAKLISKLTGQDGGHLVASSLPNWDVHIACCPFVFEITWRGGGSSGTAFTFAGGTSVHGDRLVLTPENAKDVSALAALELRASGIPQIHFVPAQPAAISLTYGGLEHAALGMATLTLQSNATELVVDNLGSSGQDGVAITLPAQGRWDGQWQTLDADGSAPKGTYLQGRLLGALADGVVQPLGVLTSTKLGPQQWGWTADFTALGASTYTVSVYDGAKLVSRLTGQDGSHLVASSLANWDVHIACCPFVFEITWRNGGSSSGTAFTFAGGTSVHGDRLVLTPENAKDVSALAALELRASGIPQIHFVPAQPAAISLTYGGLEHAALGMATLTLQSNATELVVDNLGSSGQDGVAVNLNRAARWDAAWLSTGPASAGAAGASLQVVLLGSGPSLAGRTVGTVTVTQNTSGTEDISADFSPLNSTSRTAQVYLGTNLVAEVDHQAGPIGTASGWPKDLHFRIVPLVIEITFGQDAVDLTLKGGGTARGDRLVLIPDQAPVLDYFSEVQLRATSLSNLVLTSEAPVLVPLQLQANLNESGLTLHWPGNGVLQESSDLRTWSPVPTAVSPFRPPAEGNGRFYRVVESAPSAAAP